MVRGAHPRVLFDSVTTAAPTETTCPLCARGPAADARTYRVREGLCFRSCADCRIAFRTVPADVRTLYDEAYSREITAGFRSEGSVTHARRVVRHLAKRGNPGRLLDVGSAGGDFLLEARRSGWDVAGVEPQARSVDIARAKGLTVYSPDIGRVPTRETFDAITLLDVIEHVRDPGEFLATLLSHTAPGGRLYVETPNYGSLFRALLGARWMAFIPFHEVLYSREALVRCVTEAGFRVEGFWSYGCSPLSYDGLRRLRVHKPFYNGGVLAAAALKRLGLGRLLTARLPAVAVRGLGRIVNWPFEFLIGRLCTAADQLVVVARRE